MATIVLAGGGSAGHIEPALAVARAWKLSHVDDLITFIGTRSGLENSLVPAAGFTLAHIPKVRISRRPSLTWFRIPFDLWRAVRSSRLILRNADLLIGFGGYVSAPAYIAARFSKVPAVIHEANAKPGWANRLGALLSPYVAVAFPTLDWQFRKALITGIPLRSDVAKAFMESRGNFPLARLAAKKRLGFDEHSPLLFVMGGSQGSVIINKGIESAVPFILSKGISILHSIGRNNPLPAAIGAYRPMAYIDAMADAYLASDVVIARSGAVTCSEFRTLGRYALFVPLPIGNGEQSSNAQPLVQELRAEVVDQNDFNSHYLTSHLEALLHSSAKSPNEGSGDDLEASVKIVALGEFAILSQ